MGWVENCGAQRGLGPCCQALGVWVGSPQGGLGPYCRLRTHLVPRWGVAGRGRKGPGAQSWELFRSPSQSRLRARELTWSGPWPERIQGHCHTPALQDPLAWSLLARLGRRPGENTVAAAELSHRPRTSCPTPPPTHPALHQLRLPLPLDWRQLVGSKVTKAQSSSRGTPAHSGPLPQLSR